MQYKKTFKKYSLFTLVFTLCTIFWGIWVRLSLSGDGCGKNWPFCPLLQILENKAAVIEWIHRLTSGLTVIFIFVLLVLVLKIYPPRHAIRKLAVLSFLLIIIETFIGAFLVLSGLVGLNKSEIRIWILAFHLINSLFLIGTLSLCWRLSLWDGFKVKTPHIYLVFFFPVLALTGNIASLAGQLFESQSLLQSMNMDFIPSSHISLKLRPLHPILAIFFIIALSGLGFFYKNLKMIFLVSLIVTGFGLITLMLLSPLWMKIGHVILAYGLWILLVCSCVTPDGKIGSHFDKQKSKL